LIESNSVQVNPETRSIATRASAKDQSSRSTFVERVVFFALRNSLGFSCIADDSNFGRLFHFLAISTAGGRSELNVRLERRVGGNFDIAVNGGNRRRRSLGNGPSDRDSSRESEGVENSGKAHGDDSGEVVRGTSRRRWRERDYRKLTDKMINNGFALETPMGIMIYVVSVGYWCPLFASITLKCVAEVIGAENATVNFDKAAQGVLPFITAYSRKIQGIPRSVCFGIHRLAFNVSDTGITFTQSPPITPTAFEGYPHFSTLCYMPVKTRTVPAIWSSEAGHPFQEYLARFFDDPDEFMPYMWSIGNALVDPASPSKFVVIYGRGGNGKSTVINSTMEAFGSSMAPISSRMRDWDSSFSTPLILRSIDR